MPNGVAWSPTCPHQKALGVPRCTPPARSLRRHLLHPSRRLRLAAVAQRFSPLEDRLPLLPLLVPGWDVGEDARRSAQEGAGPIEEEPPAQCRDSGQPVGQDDRCGRQRAWLRWGQEKVKGRKRHLLVDTQGLVLEARVHNANVTDRDGIKKLLLESSLPDVLPRLSHVWLEASLHRPGQGSRLGGKRAGLEYRDSATSTEAGPGRGNDAVG